MTGVFKGEIIDLTEQRGFYNKEYYVYLKEVVLLSSNAVDNNNCNINYHHLKIKVSPKQYGLLEDIGKNNNVVFSVNGYDEITAFGITKPTKFDYFKVVE